MIPIGFIRESSNSLSPESKIFCSLSSAEIVTALSAAKATAYLFRIAISAVILAPPCGRGLLSYFDALFRRQFVRARDRPSSRQLSQEPTLAPYQIRGHLEQRRLRC